MDEVNWTDTGKGAPMRTRVIGRRTTRKRGEALSELGPVTITTPGRKSGACWSRAMARAARPANFQAHHPQ